MNENIYISGFFFENDVPDLEYMEKELNKNGLSLKVRNLSGTMMNASIDFVDFELISLAYSIVNQFVVNGSYDLLKFFLKKIWGIIDKGYKSKVPFTLSIKGIPSINGKENIKIKITGSVSDDEKDNIIDKSFDLAKKIENHQFELMKGNKSIEALEGHVFCYNTEKREINEIDIEKMIQKKE